MLLKHKVIITLIILSPLGVFFLFRTAHALPFVENDISFYSAFAIMVPLLSFSMIYWCFIKRNRGKNGFEMYTAKKSKKDKITDLILIALGIPSFSLLFAWLSVDLFAFPSAIFANEKFKEEVVLIDINNAGGPYPMHQSIIYYQSSTGTNRSFLWPKDNIGDTYITSGKVKKGQTLLLIGRRWIFGSYIDRLQAPTVIR